jgi:hypothetical protein
VYVFAVVAPYGPIGIDRKLAKWGILANISNVTKLGRYGPCGDISGESDHVYGTVWTRDKTPGSVWP